MARYLLFFVFVLAFRSVSAQSTPATTTTSAVPTVTNAIVNYSFSTNKMDNLPFDKPFVFHLTDLPTTTPAFNIVRISVIQLNSKNPKPNDHNQIRQDDNQNSTLTFVLTDWKRPDGATSIATIDIPFIYTLSPNYAYQVHIELSTSRELTPDEKTQLQTTLKNDHKLDETVNELAQKSLTASPTENSNFLNVYRGIALTDLRAAVKSVNPSYELRETNVLPAIADFRDALTNLKSRLHQLDGDAPDTAKLNLVNRDLVSTDWYTVDKSAKIAGDIAPLIASFGNNPLTTTVNNAKTLQDRFARVIKTRDALIDQLITMTVLPNVYIYNTLGQTYDPNFVNNASFYINLDVGYAYVWRMDRAFAYSGFNIYFRPIDKTIPLSSYHGWDAIATRTSLLIGITFGSVEKENVRKGLIGRQAFIMGTGFKLNPFLKINGGWFMNYRYSPNPLITQNSYRFSLSPFVSLSLDMDVKPLFSGLSDSLFK